MEENRVRRPVHLADLLVIGAGFLHNLTSAIDVLTEEIMQLSIYNANRQTELNNVWEKFSTDLESITEDDNGA
jgi:hypothetical protein